MNGKTTFALVVFAALACGREAPPRERTSLPGTGSGDPAPGYAALGSEASEVAAADFASASSSPLAAFPLLQDTARTVTRRIWAEADLGSVSPDGRYASITDWDTGDLAIRDLETGEIRYLTHNPAPWEPGMADAHRISRDGKWVAYAWSTQSFEWTSYELRIVGIDGEDPRTICCDAFDGWMFPLDWSSDGRWVLAIREVRPERELVMISVEDGSTRVLKTFEDPSAQGSPHQANFSPDGRFVAYDYHKEGNDTDYDIYVLEVATLRVQVLVQSPDYDGLLGWAPDGNHILFQSDRGGTPGAWLLPVTDGRASGAPWLVKPDLWRVSGMGFGENGRYFYTVRTGKRDVFVTSFDPETRRVVGSATPVTPRRFGDAMMPFWSPDGRHLVYAAQTGPVPLQGQAWAPQSVVIQSFETGEVRELDLGMSGTPGPLGWTSDGRAVLVFSRNFNDPQDWVTLHRVDIQTSAQRVLYRVTADRSPAGFRLARDGRSIFVAWTPLAPSGEEDQRGSYRIEREDLETGETTELFRTPVGGPGQVRGFALSSDGRTLAFGYCPAGGPDRLVVLPVEGGAIKEVLAGTFNSVAWMPDGEALLAYGTIEEEVLYVDLAGGEARPIGISGWVPYFSLDVHPDGDRITYTAGTTGTELWVMENFLPGTR